MCRCAGSQKEIPAGCLLERLCKIRDDTVNSYQPSVLPEVLNNKDEHCSLVIVTKLKELCFSF